jgi:dTDP-4-dehydrorhamnose 3,5-epimerase
LEQALKIHATPLAGVYQVELDWYADGRGAFSRLFCAAELGDLLGERRIVQVNHSRSEIPGTVRGMHFQVGRYAEMKLITCTRGSVYDVAVDLRPNSPTYLRWYGVELAGDSHRMMLIPEGCAHGFQVMSPESELIYSHTAAYTPAAEGGVRYDDPALHIRWPLPVGEVSARDRSHPLIDNEFKGIAF